jgi:hypothetical protein
MLSYEVSLIEQTLRSITSQSDQSGAVARSYESVARLSLVRPSISMTVWTTLTSIDLCDDTQKICYKKSGSQAVVDGCAVAAALGIGRDVNSIYSDEKMVSIELRPE